MGILRLLKDGYEFKKNIGDDEECSMLLTASADEKLY